MVKINVRLTLLLMLDYCGDHFQWVNVRLSRFPIAMKFNLFNNRSEIELCQKWAELSWFGWSTWLTAHTRQAEGEGQQQNAASGYEENGERIH